MNKIQNILIASFAGIAAIGVSHAQIMTVDFESPPYPELTSGSNELFDWGNGAYENWSRNNTNMTGRLYAEGGTNPSSPQGTQYARFNTDTSYRNAQLNFSPSQNVTGTVGFDLFFRSSFVNAANPWYIGMSNGAQIANPFNGPQIAISNNGAGGISIGARHDDGGATITNISTTLSNNTWYQLSLTANSSSGLFDVSLFDFGGTQIGSSLTDLTMLNAAGFTGGFNRVVFNGLGSTVFVDDIQVVPEPAYAAVLIGTLALLVAFRRLRK